MIKIETKKLVNTFFILLSAAHLQLSAQRVVKMPGKSYRKPTFNWKMTENACSLFGHCRSHLFWYVLFPALSG